MYGSINGQVIGEGDFILKDAILISEGVAWQLGDVEVIDGFTRLYRFQDGSELQIVSD